MCHLNSSTCNSCQWSRLARSTVPPLRDKQVILAETQLQVEQPCDKPAYGMLGPGSSCGTHPRKYLRSCSKREALSICGKSSTRPCSSAQATFVIAVWQSLALSTLKLATALSGLQLEARTHICIQCLTHTSTSTVPIRVEQAAACQTWLLLVPAQLLFETPVNMPEAAKCQCIHLQVASALSSWHKATTPKKCCSRQWL